LPDGSLASSQVRSPGRRPRRRCSSRSTRLQISPSERSPLRDPGLGPPGGALRGRHHDELDGPAVGSSSARSAAERRKPSLSAHWHRGTLAPRHVGTEAPRHRGTEALRHRGTEARWHRGTLAPRHVGTEAPRAFPCSPRSPPQGRRAGASLPATPSAALAPGRDLRSSPAARTVPQLHAVLRHRTTGINSCESQDSGPRLVGRRES
jgi:hypothetical protein